MVMMKRQCIQPSVCKSVSSIADGFKAQSARLGLKVAVVPRLVITVSGLLLRFALRRQRAVCEDNGSGTTGSRCNDAMLC